MAAANSDLICINVDEEEVRVCKWDGREIRLGRTAARDGMAISQAIITLAPRDGFQLRYQLVGNAAVVAETARRIEEAGRDAGAGAIRRLPVDIQAEPGLTAARQAADRHRLGETVCVELRERSYLCARVDERGRAGAHERGKSVDTSHVCAAVKRMDGNADALICYGGAATDAIAVDIARGAGIRRILIPDYAASLALVGMLIVDLVFELWSVAPPGSSDLRGIREGFARLMDEAARQATLEGYDIDDTICERLVELTDRSVLPFEATKATEGGGSSIGVQGLRLRVTIQTPKFALPGDGMGRLFTIDR